MYIYRSYRKVNTGVPLFWNTLYIKCQTQLYIARGRAASKSFLPTASQLKQPFKNVHPVAAWKHGRRTFWRVEILCSCQPQNLNSMVIPSCELCSIVVTGHQHQQLCKRCTSYPRHVCLSVCSSVCPSRAGIVSKRPKLGSRGHHWLIVPGP